MGSPGSLSLLECKKNLLFVKARHSWNQTPRKQEIAKILGKTGALFFKGQTFSFTVSRAPIKCQARDT